MRTTALSLLLAPLVLAGASAAAAEPVGGDNLSIVPQLLVGTAGVEPGLAIEYRPDSNGGLIVRPEAFISEDGRVGAGGAVLWELSRDAGLPARQSLAVGPRVLYHNADDYGWEIDAAGIYGFDLNIDRAWRHSLEVIAAIGAVRDRKHDDTDVGLSFGGAYAFRF